MSLNPNKPQRGHDATNARPDPIKRDDHPRSHFSHDQVSAVPLRFGLLMSLAIRDLLHDRQVALCIIFSLVAVIAPLLLLFGLKTGIVGQLRTELLNDPANLEVRMIGNGNYPLPWLAELAQRPEVGFAVPLTRALNTQGDLVRDSRLFVANAEVLPTAIGDPLLAGVPLPPDAAHLVLSASAAARLQIKVGQQLQFFVARKLDGVSERGHMIMTVSGILSAARFARPAAFVTLPQLVAMEDFRDGFHVPQFGVDTGSPAPIRDKFAKARVYARNIDAVAPLALWLNQQHIETVTRQAEIESVRAITYVLGVIFAVIAWVSLLGCIASLIGAFLANIDRKRKDMAVLRLLGFRSRAVSLYIMLQALLLTGVAFLCGLMLYLAGSTLFNHILGRHLPGNTFVCRLQPAHLMLALASTLTIAVVVAGIGAARAIQIQPAESLRDI
ncbi:FtsX-like permease family protein [Acerihabitans sp. TG2]|uniref:ABC transporter permease n=1 Tax=Acerihabitans sp. TG2 TaxID=3096008 RepID=UPI002B2338B6|nr:FtsX-like permease family protein [Acerihabitans sp. TG2]MEA9391540.1 FtsX-like permease family protein [Acerihabitans sp. TG2]